MISPKNLPHEKPSIELLPIKKSESHLRIEMAAHYSKPRGFVARSIIYAIIVSGVRYGSIAAGSAVLHLPGRNEFFKPLPPLNNIVNNTFFHVEKIEKKYPLRNFTTAVVALWRRRVIADWENKYGDPVLGFETLIELPRSGELYVRDGWTHVGQTKGFTCKRIAGRGTDSWSGKRVWDTDNLRPKLVFVRTAS